MSLFQCPLFLVLSITTTREVQFDEGCNEGYPVVSATVA